ncbi:MAG: hypothetical protein RSD40_05765 [Bacilli bacterium]
MNVIVSNLQEEALSSLDIDIIKNVHGEYDAEEIVSMFKNFFFGRMILDVTAIKNYQDFTNIQKISIDLDVDKIILLLPNNEEISSPSFLSKIISMGIYNFTTNIEGVKYLLDHPNSYKDVAHIQQLNELASTVNEKVSRGSHIIGVKNITDHAGATTLIYMLKKELEQSYGMTVICIEVGKHDFSYLNDKDMISVSEEKLAMELMKAKGADVIFIDLNMASDEGVSDDVLYLIEPSSIKLNKLMRRDRFIFDKLKGKKIILNKSLLTSSDINDFEFEAKAKIYYNIPPLDERKKNQIISSFLVKLGLIAPVKEEESLEKNKILGLFKF